MLLRELSADPRSRDRLAERTGLDHATLDHALACLYYAGCITTSPTKAAQPSELRYRQRDSSGAALLSEDVVSTYVEK
jgi:DNA-binding transcriptional ArsR family regulator